MPTFRRPVQVIRRLPGGYVDGDYVPAPLPSPVTVQMGVQPATASDYAALEAMPGGRRGSEMRRGYTAIADALTAAGTNGLPGDLVLLDGDPWLIIGAPRRDVLGGGISHVRHLLVRHDDETEGQPT